MIAPKINGHAMQTMYWDEADQCGNWLSSFDSGALDIRVYQNSAGECAYRISYNNVLISNSNVEYESSPQAAAEAAAEFLCKVHNLLTNLNFIWTAR